MAHGMLPVLELDVLAGRYAIARLDASDPIPPWALGAEDELGAVVRRGPELSVVCLERRVPAEAVAERGYAALAVRGPLDLSVTGILAALAGVLAAAGIPIFAISTYDTDVLLVPHGRLEAAVAALVDAGHLVSRFS